MLSNIYFQHLINIVQNKYCVFELSPKYAIKIYVFNNDIEKKLRINLYLLQLKVIQHYFQYLNSVQYKYSQYIKYSQKSDIECVPEKPAILSQSAFNEIIIQECT